MSVPPPSMRGQAHLLPFSGSAHPTGESDDYDGIFLTQSQIANKAKTVVASPVWYEHDGTKKVGWITGGSVDDRGRLIVHGVIDRNSDAGTAAARQLRDGNLTGLSLGMDHLKYEDKANCFMKIVDSRIKEVSVTANPDLHDTEITGVAENSEVWKEGEKFIRGKIQKYKTKTQIDKNRLEIQRLEKESAKRKPQTRTIHTTASAMEAQDPVAPPAVAAAADPVGAPPAQDLSEAEALRQKNAALEKQLASLAAQKAEQDAKIAAVQDPNTNAILGQHKAKMLALQAQMAADEDAIIESMTADLVAAGAKVDEDLLNAIREGKDRPETYKPVYKFLKSAAGAAARVRATEVEAKYQAERVENERTRKDMMDMRAQLVEVQSARDQMTSQYQLQQQQQQAAAKKVAFASHTSNPAPQKRARGVDVDDASAAAAAAPASADGTAPVAYPGLGVATFDTMSGAPKGAGLTPIPATGDQDILGMFHSTKMGSGMGAASALPSQTGALPPAQPTRASFF